MISWPAPHVPAVPGPAIPLAVYNPVTDQREQVRPAAEAGLYVCGITPYDATHLGHAATYLTFDIVNRVLRDNGHTVNYVQNITDIDDPLLERAARDAVDWRELAHQETELFREDMTALSILPPRNFVSVVESIPAVVADVLRLRTGGSGYSVPPTEPVQTGAGLDYYCDLTQLPTFGAVSEYSAEQMLTTFAERGGDPDRAGKRNPLDPLLWRAARVGEPAWPGGELGLGRPGWHIECTTIALSYLGAEFDIQGGGTDLLFPHHEMSAAQAHLLGAKFARHYIHQAMVGLGGQKMSKSQGNLVLVSALRATGVNPMEIRLLLLDQHYRVQWSYTDNLLSRAGARLDRWRQALSRDLGPDSAPTVAQIRAALADDLDTPAALIHVDRWAEQQLASGGSMPGAPGVLARALDALLGIRL